MMAVPMTPVVMAVVLAALALGAVSVVECAPQSAPARPAAGGILPEPDVNMNITQIIARWGYPAENYEIVTTDGYILQIQRIPHGVKQDAPSDGKRPALLVVHGLFSSAFDFVNNPSNESFGFVMADAGYDVWLGNVRGNVYSRRHKTMSPSEEKFWEFSFDEFIAIDVPAMIDFVLNHTGQPSLYYVGHSQGTGVMFGLLASQPAYQEKIRAFAAMGPVANVTYLTTPVKYIAPFSNDLDWVAEWIGLGELGNYPRIVKVLADTVCAFSVSRELCVACLWIGMGVDGRQLNATRLPVYLSHIPAGTSVRNLVHFGQEVESERFGMYNFGEAENLKRYGQPTPPDYDISKITKTPTALYWSDGDNFATPKNVAIIEESMPSVVRSIKVSEETFSHVDFLIAIYARQLVYDDIIQFFQQH